MQSLFSAIQTIHVSEHFFFKKKNWFMLDVCEVSGENCLHRSKSVVYMYIHTNISMNVCEQGIFIPVLSLNTNIRFKSSKIQFHLPQSLLASDIKTKYV